MRLEEMTTGELLESDVPRVLPIPTRVGAARRTLVGMLGLAVVESGAAAALCSLAGGPIAVIAIAVVVSGILRAIGAAAFVHNQRILHRAARADPGGEPFAPSPRVIRNAERLPLPIAGAATVLAALAVALFDAASVPLVLAVGAFSLAPAGRWIGAPLESWIARLPASDLPPVPTGMLALREAVITASPPIGVGLTAFAMMRPDAPMVWVAGALALVPGVVMALVEARRALFARRELAEIAAEVDAYEPDAEAITSPPAPRTDVGRYYWEAVRAEIDAAARALRAESDAQKQIEHEEEVRARFMAAMSHELRSPLNSIVGFAQLLEDGNDGPLTDDQRESVVMVRRSSEELLRLLGDILDSARLDAGRLRLKRAWIPSVEIVTAAVTVGRSIIEGTRVRIETQIQAGLPPVHVDRARIVQAVVATLRHAVRGLEGGAIELRAGVGASRIGDESLVIEVRDRARTLGDDELAHLFDAFGGLRDAASGRRIAGLGLALSLARKLVRLHGGDVWAERPASGGTAFVVALPLEDAS